MAQYVYLVLLQSIMLACSTPVTVTSFNFSTLGVLVANGSSAVGGCSNVTLNLDGTSTCNDPSSSVLFDGNIPTLTALDGDTWARQLMILYRPEFGYSSSSINFGFTMISQIRRVEVTIFNCPQWGTGVEDISVIDVENYYNYLATAYPTIISCSSLLKVCISFNEQYTNDTKFKLEFHRYSGVQYVHIAEIAFYSSSTPCPPFTTIPGNWTPPLDAENTTSTSSFLAPTENGATEEIQGNSEESSTLLTVLSLLVAIMILETIVIFIVVIVIACRRKGTSSVPRKAETFEMEDQVYETMGAGDKSHESTGKGKKSYS